MSGQALYRRWRPQRFGEVVGQEHVTRTLRNAVKLGRVAHGYLFCGPRGVAKTSTARILAKAINCLNPHDGEPCNACELCRAITEGTSYDVIEMDAASNGLVDNVRDLRQHVMTHPDQAHRKVYILDEAHRMSAPAFDALLKTLEEPPAHVVFVLVTSEPDRIPATIVSRCQRFDFRRLAQRGIVGRLSEICQAEGVTIAPAALDLIARAATGSMRDAQSVLDQLFALGGGDITLPDVETVLGTAGEAAAAQLATHVVRRDQAAGLRLISQVVAEGADPRQFCRDATEYLRDLLLLKLGGPDESLDVAPETLAAMTELAKEADVGQLLRAVKLFGQADIGWRGTLHFQLPLELAFVEAALDPAAAMIGATTGAGTGTTIGTAAGAGTGAATTPAAPGVPGALPISFRAQRGISAGGPAPTAPTRPPTAVPVEIPRRSAPRDDAEKASTPRNDAERASAAPGDTKRVSAAPDGAARATADPDGAERAPASHDGYGNERPDATSGVSAGQPAPPPAQPESPAADVPAPIPRGEIAFADVRARWTAVKRAIKANSPRLEAFLNDVRPVRVEGSKLVLEARFGAHQRHVMEHKNRSLLEGELERALGQALHIECGVAESWAPEDDELDPRDTPMIRAAIQRGWRARLLPEPEPVEPVQ